MSIVQSLSYLSMRLVFFFSLGLPIVTGAEPEESKNLLESVCPKSEISEPRRRPGSTPHLKYQDPTCHTDQLSAPRAEDFIDLTPVPDRWRIVEAMGYPVNWLDPYHGTNPLKGDRPFFGKDWFINVDASSSSVFEFRRLPIAHEINNGQEGSKSFLRTREQIFFNQNFSFDTVLYKGDTVFRPPDYQFRFTPVINYNQTNSDGDSREKNAFAIQALFVEKHLRDVSDHYDFDSIRIGIQPFTSDFRGFLLLDQQLGVRLFGTRNNNVFQYNLAWLRRLSKHNNSLNDLGSDLPDNDVFIANLYWQDLLVSGLTSQFTVAYNRSREHGTHIIVDDFANSNPATFEENSEHDYDVVYLGYNGDGHFGRINLTGSMYYALGTESKGIFVDSETDVRAFFAAAEISTDFDWFKLKFSALHASGDDDPFDGSAEGFDGIFQNPLFAGTNFSFFNHQSLPLSGNKISLKRNNALFNSLRSQADPGQSNFTNPGVNLIGVGADFDVMPELKVSLQANQIWFDETATLEAVLGEQDIANNIGLDLSLAATYRPLATQNLILSLSAATLLPGQGYRDIYDGRMAYSIFANIIVSY